MNIRITTPFSHVNDIAILLSRHNLGIEQKTFDVVGELNSELKSR